MRERTQLPPVKVFIHENTMIRIHWDCKTVNPYRNVSYSGGRPHYHYGVTIDGGSQTISEELYEQIRNWIREGAKFET